MQEGKNIVSITVLPIDKHEIDLTETPQGTVSPNGFLILEISNAWQYDRIVWYKDGYVIDRSSLLVHSIPWDAQPGPYNITVMVEMWNFEKNMQEYFSNTLLFRVVMLE
jgi:hypothetical protein